MAAARARCRPLPSHCIRPASDRAGSRSDDIPGRRRIRLGITHAPFPRPYSAGPAGTAACPGSPGRQRRLPGSSLPVRAGDPADLRFRLLDPRTLRARGGRCKQPRHRPAQGSLRRAETGAGRLLGRWRGRSARRRTQRRRAPAGHRSGQSRHDCLDPTAPPVATHRFTEPCGLPAIAGRTPPMALHRRQGPDHSARADAGPRRSLPPGDTPDGAYRAKLRSPLLLGRALAPAMARGHVSAER